MQVFCSASATDIQYLRYKAQIQYNYNIIYAQCAHFCHILAKLTISFSGKKDKIRTGISACSWDAQTVQSRISSTWRASKSVT